MLNKGQIRPAGCSYENFPAFRLNGAFWTHVRQESQVARKATALEPKSSDSAHRRARRRKLASGA
ncbi:MAG: hypothetical protein DMF09_04130 [Verrucomicrobia bacterium]|nr:MAG: hypothetical protein DMF09_04130 [Verrucomicrobiota bacterium]